MALDLHQSHWSRKKTEPQGFALKVNDLTKKDAHPLPKIDDMLDTLGKAQWFLTLDLANGY